MAPVPVSSGMRGGMPEREKGEEVNEAAHSECLKVWFTCIFERALASVTGGRDEEAAAGAARERVRGTVPSRREPKSSGRPTKKSAGRDGVRRREAEDEEEEGEGEVSNAARSECLRVWFTCIFVSAVAVVTEGQREAVTEERAAAVGAEVAGRTAAAVGAPLTAVAAAARRRAACAFFLRRAAVVAPVVTAPPTATKAVAEAAVAAVVVVAVVVAATAAAAPVVREC